MRWNAVHRTGQKDMQQHLCNILIKTWLTSKEASTGDYVKAVGWGQQFAKTNREIMMQHVIDAMRKIIPKPFETHLEAVNCHHNYVQKEKHFGEEVYVTRKGAVSAKKGELGIIPGSMGARSYIVRGLGTKKAFNPAATVLVEP